MPPRSLARGAALNLAARLAAVALGLAILVTVARLGPAVQGAFALFVAIESALLTLFSGLGLLLARELSHREARPGPLLGALLLAALGLGVVAALVLLGASVWAEAEPYRHLWLLALAAPFLLLVPTASGLWLGQGRMGPLNAPQVAAPALVLGLLLVLTQGAAPAALAVLAAWVLGKALVGVCTGLAAWRDAGPAAPDAGPLRGQWRFVATIGATNVVSLLNYRATLFLLERHGGLAEAGVYSVAVQVAELLWLLSSAVTVSAYHRIGAPDAQQAARTTLRAVQVNLLATLAAAPLLYAGATLALPRVLGAAYAGALLPLGLLLPGIAGYAAASSLSAYYTNQRGRPQWSAAIAGLSLALTLAIAAWSIPRYGAAGAALATSLAYGLAIAVALALFLRDTRLPWTALFGGRHTRQSGLA
ncbi:lipopolysaccharide biosynthesis protein [Methylibium sp.]|uniref:lipopolysaccharide biosynthesis protein n=1 Tax=Methylibium sp. TaxID=2067992 RepID=UPI003D10527F